MPSLLRLAAAAGFTLLFAAGGSLLAEPAAAQTKAAKESAKPRLARLYFLYPSMISTPFPIGLAVDGVQVTKIHTGTYVSVDRRPGKHKIAMQGVVGIPWTYEAEIEIGPGSHYFELGPSGRFDYPIGFGAFSRAANGVTGKQIKGSLSSPGLVFLEVEPQGGPAALAKLKPAAGS
jgi:hypothetical protein